MPRARGSLLVLVGPRKSHHSLQGDVLILKEELLDSQSCPIYVYTYISIYLYIYIYS